MEVAEIQSRVSEHLKKHPVLSVGLGDEESHCSIAAINLAINGKLTDDVPPCMSEVIGKWIIGIQDEMPDGIRNSQRWLDLLPLAAGTGRDHEPERLQLVMDWMWGRVLPHIQPVADKFGFGDKWLEMTNKRTSEAALAASKVALAKATSKLGNWAAEWAAREAVKAAAAASDAVSRWEAMAVAARCVAAAAASYAVARLEAVARWETMAAAASDALKAWEHFDPCGLLQKLIEVGNK